MRSALGIRNITLLRTCLRLLPRQRLMLRLRRSCPTLGQWSLLQRRRAGKSGHAQRISCSSPDGIEECWEVKEKWRVEGGGGLPVRPFCSRFCASRFHCSSHLLLEGRNSRNGVEGLTTVSMLVRVFFLLSLFLFPTGVLSCVFRNMYGRSFVFPYLCLCLSAERILDKVRG